MRFILSIIFLIGPMSAIASSESCFIQDPDLSKKIIHEIPNVGENKFLGIKEFPPGSKESKFWGIGYLERDRLFEEVLKPFDKIRVTTGHSACSAAVEFEFQQGADRVNVECMVGIVIAEGPRTYYNVKKCEKFSDNKSITEILNSIQSKVP
jgi:hypothetical protein